MLISGHKNSEIVLWHLRGLPAKLDATLTQRVIRGTERPGVTITPDLSSKDPSLMPKDPSYQPRTAPEIRNILVPYRFLDTGLLQLAPITTMLWLDNPNNSLCHKCLRIERAKAKPPAITTMLEDRESKSEATCVCGGSLVVGHGKQVSILVDYLCVTWL